MEDKRIKVRRTGIAKAVTPAPYNPIVPELGRLGVSPPQIIGWQYSGDDLTGLEKFRDYSLAFFGVADQEFATRIFLDNESQGEVLFCWQVLIYWNDHHDAFIEAMWFDDKRDFDVIIQMGRLDTLRPDVAGHLADGLPLLQWVHTDLKDRRGGDRTDPLIRELWCHANCKRFALLVKEVLPKWSWIKSNDYDPKFSKPKEWVSEVRQRPEFSIFFGAYKAPIDDLLLRVTDNNLNKEDREPTALACMHAARELGFTDVYKNCNLPEPATSTLKKYYLRGSANLENDRDEQR